MNETININNINKYENEQSFISSKIKEFSETIHKIKDYFKENDATLEQFFVNEETKFYLCASCLFLDNERLELCFCDEHNNIIMLLVLEKEVGLK